MGDCLDTAGGEPDHAPRMDIPGYGDGPYKRARRIGEVRTTAVGPASTNVRANGVHHATWRNHRSAALHYRRASFDGEAVARSGPRVSADGTHSGGQAGPWRG